MKAKYKSKDSRRMAQYNKMLELARDKSSTFYNEDGTHNRSASHRAMFWNGYTYGKTRTNMTPHSSCISYCIWRAGMDYRTETNNTGE
jgi:hypothetical protein